MEIYDITVKDRHEKDVSLSIYRGMVLLIVNTATDCIFTPQYVGLQDLYWKLNASGFEILDFPCNQFAGQAPGTSEEIFDFSFSNFGITFPQFAKIDVNGPNESPLYTFLKAKHKGFFSSKIKWNFTKFLVDRKGRVVKRYGPTTKPEKISQDIQRLLQQKKT
ncbi:MAG: glutathione peroxidase [Candidatus Izemoplasmatales bacterium]|jgi:glutathione peroxidase